LVGPVAGGGAGVFVAGRVVIRCDRAEITVVGLRDRVDRTAEGLWCVAEILVERERQLHRVALPHRPEHLDIERKNSKGAVNPNAAAGRAGGITGATLTIPTSPGTLVKGTAKTAATVI